MHVVFSTKHRLRSLSTLQIRMHVWRYIAGIAEQNGFPALAVGGYDDHCHVLIELPATIMISKAVQKIKGVSSKWLTDTYTEFNDFAWQEGYSAFSVSTSQVKRVVEYIDRQEEHHKRIDFKDEYIEFLKRNNIQYDDRYVFG